MNVRRYVLNHQNRLILAPNAPPSLNTWVPSEDVDKLRGDVLQVVKAQHEAIDRLFAMLINNTRGHLDDRPFMPSQSGQPWEAAKAGTALIKVLEQ